MPEEKSETITVLVKIGNDDYLVRISAGFEATLQMLRKKLETKRSTSGWRFELEGAEIDLDEEANFKLSEFKTENSSRLSIKMRRAREARQMNILVTIDGNSQRLTIRADLDTSLVDVRRAIELETGKSIDSVFVLGDEEIQRKDEAHYTLRNFSKDNGIVLTMRIPRRTNGVVLTIKLDSTSMRIEYKGNLTDGLNYLRTTIWKADILPEKVEDFRFLTPDGDEILKADEEKVKISEVVKDHAIRIKKYGDSAETEELNKERDKDKDSKPSEIVEPSKIEPKSLKKNWEDKTGDDAFVAPAGDARAGVDVIFQKLQPDDQWWLIHYWNLDMGLNSRCEMMRITCAYRYEGLPEISIPNPETKFVSKFFFTSEELELVRHTSWNAGINAKGGFGPVRLALSADLRRSIDEDHFKSKQSISIFSSYSIRRLRLKFDLRDIKPAPTLAKRIEELVEDLERRRSSRQTVFQKLESLFKEFGTHIATEVIVGAMLFSLTEKQFERSNDAIAAKTTFQAAFSGKVASIASAGVKVDIESSEQERTEIETQMKTMKLESVGGEGSLAGEPAKWLETTLSHLNWRIIEFKDEGVHVLPEIFPPKTKKTLYELARDFKFSDELRMDSERYLEFWRQSVLDDQARVIGDLFEDKDLEQVTVKNKGKILAEGLYGLYSKQEIILVAESKPKQLTEGKVYEVYADGNQFSVTYHKFENGRLYFTVK